MKKSLIALAIAGVVAAPAAFAATANVDVYGLVSVAYEFGDTHEGTVDSKASRIGVKGSEDLGGGLTAIYKAEFLIADLSTPSTGQTLATASSGTAGNTVSNRDTFVGVKGAFGTVILGNHGTPEKISMGANQWEDSIGDKGQILAGESGYANKVVAYISPDYNGLHAAVATVQTTGTADDSVASSYALIYKNGALGVNLGGTINEAPATGDTKTLTVSYGIAGVDLRASFQESKTVAATSTSDFDSFYVDATYKMGAMDLTAAYGERDLVNAGSDLKATTLGVKYNLSKRTNVQLIWNNLETAGVDASNTALQLNHAF